MAEIKEKRWNGRKVAAEMEFQNDGNDFSGYYESVDWCHAHGYNNGSMDAGARGNPIAIQKGEYTLPWKWHNFEPSDKKLIDGVIISDNWRNGSVKVLIFE